MVECDLAKVEVAGSNPVSRSRILVLTCCRQVISLPNVRGAVPKW